MFVCDFGEWKREHNVKQGKFLKCDGEEGQGGQAQKKNETKENPLC